LGGDGISDEFAVFDIFVEFAVAEDVAGFVEDGCEQVVFIYCCSGGGLVGCVG
jgi:hypothetical protein